MTITLEQIDADHKRISALIEAFRAQSRTTEIAVPAVTIPLAAGERLAGAILNEDGSVAHWLILLPGEAESVNWEGAQEWAAERGGELPTRREQALLYSNLKDEFSANWYWSGEAHTTSGWAWCQSFGYGSQTSSQQRNDLRARAVRRFIPSVI